MSYEISGNVLKGRYATYQIVKTQCDYVAIYQNWRMYRADSLAKLLVKIKKAEDGFDER